MKKIIRQDISHFGKSFVKVYPRALRSTYLYIKYVFLLILTIITAITLDKTL